LKFVTECTCFRRPGTLTVWIPSAGEEQSHLKCLICQVPIYLVKWKGCPSAENTWEPEKNLTLMGRGMVDEYLKSQPQGELHSRPV
jgi:hypothetical protein